MKTVGIICEYNPFHNGHCLQISKLRHEHDADTIVCAMSGYFMQRGEPAVADKERRTRMALAGGADLVLELPALYATRSAYWFALGGVSLLASAGATHLAFGAETDSLPAFRATAARLADPDPAYTEALRRFLAAGLPFPEAHAKALCGGGGGSGGSGGGNFAPALPNDRLALAYLQVIAEKNLPLEPILIPRSGSAYHETALPPGTAPAPAAEPTAAGSPALNFPASEAAVAVFPASATALRRQLQDGLRLYRCQSLSLDRLKLLGLARHIPVTALPYLADTPLVFPSDAAPVEMALLRRADRQALLALPDMTEGLENRVTEAAAKAGDLAEFYRLLKTRRYPLTRIQRLVTHLFLDYRTVMAAGLAEGPPYLRVLGANPAGRRLLHQIKKNSPIPIITRTRQIKELIRQNPRAAMTWELEARSAALYALLAGNSCPKGNPEYLLSPVML